MVKLPWILLIDLAGDASFVLLGEASHGTHEFYWTRAAITERMIKEKGFQAVAVEADWPDAYHVNHYVRSRSAAAQHERLSRITGLAVVGCTLVGRVCDAMLEVLVPVGLLAVSCTRPLAFLIAGLLIVVKFSYRQTIHAYPQGAAPTLLRRTISASCRVSLRQRRFSGQAVTVLIPELRPRHWWQTLLHEHWSVQLRSALEDHSHVRVIASFEWPFKH